ncbi:MAG: hypothetical protein IT366_24530 [Candidatus Hydrogenedentes bacterium]|nr:hypothetical protein [Candidatus Hydrogenedentota bacterium]
MAMMLQNMFAGPGMAAGGPVGGFDSFAWNQGPTALRGGFQNPAYPMGKNKVETLSPAQVAIVKKRIQRSMRAKKELGLLDIWDTLEAYYEGKYFKQLSAEHQVSVNYMFSIIRQTVAALYFQDPTFYMKGMSETGRLVAPIMEQVLAYEREVIDAESAERDFLWNSVMFGIGILKHGYSSAIAPEMAIRDRGMRPGRGIEHEDFDMPQADTVENDQRMRVGHPWTWAISPHDFFIDPDAKKWTESRWFCHRYNRPYIDVLQDSRLDINARAELEPTGKSGYFLEEDIREDDHHRTRLMLENDASICRLYEYYDVQNACITLLSDNGERPLLYKHYPYLKELTPYERLVFFESRKHPWGIPYPNTFRSQIEVLNVIRSQQLQHLETWGWTRGAVSVDKLKNKEDAKKFLKSRGPKLIEIQGTDTKPADVISLFDRQDIPSDSWKISDVHYNDLIDISGANELGARSTETATEASYQEQKHNLRVGDMRYFNDRALKGSARRLIVLLKTFWGTERVVPICGADGKLWEMVRIPREWVLAEYEVDIEPGSTERVDKVVRTRQIIDAMTQLAPWIPLLKEQGMTLFAPELISKYLQNTDVFRNSQRLLIPYQPPMVDANGNPLPGQPSAQPGGLQLPGPTSEGPMDAMPQLQDAGLVGRALSEGFGGGAFGGSIA